MWVREGGLESVGSRVWVREVGIVDLGVGGESGESGEELRQ